MKGLSRFAAGLVLVGALAVPQTALANPFLLRAGEVPALKGLWSWVMGWWLKEGPGAHPDGSPGAPGAEQSFLQQGPHGDPLGLKAGPGANPDGQPAAQAQTSVNSGTVAVGPGDAPGG